MIMARTAQATSAIKPLPAVMNAEATGSPNPRVETSMMVAIWIRKLHTPRSRRSYALAMRPTSLLIGLVLLLGACSAASGAAPGSGIAGRVVAAPTCPVETVPPQPQCAPKPLVARLRIHRAGSRFPSTVLRTGVNGRFQIRLAPATYVVEPLRQNGSLYPRPPAPVQVRVDAAHFTHITITYDTGIR